MEYAREHLPGISADIEFDTSKSLRSRQSVMDAVAELMRRINYVPDAASLSENRGHWRSALDGDHMRDPKRAVQAYKRFAADMNDDMVKSLRHELECRVAQEKGLPEPAPPVRTGTDDDGWKERPANPRPALFEYTSNCRDVGSVKVDPTGERQIVITQTDMGLTRPSVYLLVDINANDKGASLKSYTYYANSPWHGRADEVVSAITDPKTCI